MYERLSLRLRIFLFFALLGLGGVAAVLAGLWFGYRRLDAGQPLSSFVTAGVIGGLGILGLVAWVWLMFDENVAKPILKLAGGLRTHAHTSGGAAIDHRPARYLGDLGPAASALTENLVAAKGGVDTAVAETTGALAAEKDQLQSLLACLPAAIVMCGADHRIAFYNGEAADLLADAPPRLGRSVFDCLRPEPVEAAYDRLDPGAATEFVCASQGSDRTVHVRMRRSDASGATAYALVLRDLGRVSTSRESWPTCDFAAADVVRTLTRSLAARRIEIDQSVADVTMTGDPLQLAALLAHLAERLSAQGGKTFSLLVTEEDDAARVVLGWSGDPPDPAVLNGWLEEDLDPGVSYVSGRSILELHGTDVTLTGPTAGRAALGLAIPLAQRDPRAPSLRAVFDFALAHPLPEGSDRLRDRVFVVFDSETTGLDPQSDEVVQLAAVRMVNGRIVAGETLDTYVNPGRRIPAASTKVHGVTDAMVSDAPDIGAAGRAFHRFAEGAVLVAHNAPFDMAFLRRHEQAIGQSFDHPVLDTVLLSAILFGQSEVHSLDALTKRLGLGIDDSLRHTAMGDARGTAEALEQMIPMLEAAGFETVSDVIAAARKHGRLLKDLN